MRGDVKDCKSRLSCSSTEGSSHRKNIFMYFLCSSLLASVFCFVSTFLHMRCSVSVYHQLIFFMLFCVTVYDQEYRGELNSSARNCDHCFANSNRNIRHHTDGIPYQSGIEPGTNHQSSMKYKFPSWHTLGRMLP